MKHLKKILLVVLLSSTVFAFGSFCDGWKDGYKAGYTYKMHKYALSPLPPVCPFPELGRDQYQDGYNRGFIRGMRDRQDGK